MNATTVPLHRSTAQRRVGAAMVAFDIVFVGALLVVVPVVLGRAVARGDAPTWSIVVLMLLVVAFGFRTYPMLKASWRLWRGEAGGIELFEDRLVVTAPTLLTEPVVVHRHDISSITPAPSGALSMGILGEARHRRGVLMSVISERPNLFVGFTSPRVLPVHGRLDGLFANATIRPPVPGVPAHGLWVRSDGAPIVYRWFNPTTAELEGPDFPDG